MVSSLREANRCPGRFDGAVACALVAHGRWREALDVAREASSPFKADVFAELIVQLVRCGQQEAALSLGAHLPRDHELAAWTALTPAMAALVPQHIDRMRAAFEEGLPFIEALRR